MDLAHLKQLATERLDPVAADYINRGSADGTTRAANLAAWHRLRLHPHVLRDVSDVDTSTTVLGTPVDDAHPRRADRHAAPASHDDGEGPPPAPRRRSAP